MRTPLSLIPILVVLGGCCRDAEAPVWLSVEDQHISAGTTELSLLDWVEDPDEPLSFAVATGDDLITELDGAALALTPQPGWTGVATLELTATDDCGNWSGTSVRVVVGEEPDDDDLPTLADHCPVTLRYTAQGEPDAVAVAGLFNGWDTGSDRLSREADAWTVTLDLAPGSYPYKLVEIDEGTYGDAESWTCDPAAEYIQCDEGYKSPDDTSWSQDCTLNATSCNSLLIVPDCGRPSLTLTAVELDRGAGAARADVSVAPAVGGAALASGRVTLNGAEIDGGFDGGAFHVELSGLAAERYALRFTVMDEEGVESEELYLPFWMDDFSWDSAVLYYAFIDRLADGDPDNDASEGASALTGDYMGGDWQGLIDLLPYLEDLGVNALWITNPQDNSAGGWDGQCDETYAGYHGYWPTSAAGLEEHFGDEATLRELVDAAHARGLRVMVDWVANHVALDHPYYQEHPDWFGDYAWCEDGNNWNEIPETCWFAPYLPDVDYYNPEPLVAMVDDAVDLAQTWDLDGLRVDAAKHMPHSVQWNLEHAIQARIEHEAAGGEDHFWTVGETFDSYDRINAYIDEDQLDGQFDFPLYYTIRSAFLDGSTTLPDLVASAEYSERVYAGGLMGTFLGNHDVPRFVTAGTESDLGGCEPDGVGVRAAAEPSDTGVYDSLKLAFTFLFTRPGVPLVYYGDEIGLPGYGDPDNRQPMWWYTGDLSGGAVEGVSDMAAAVGGPRAEVVEAVGALGRARASHPAFYSGETTEWWREDDLVAYARVSGADAVLVILNRSGSDRTLSNGLSYAGLSGGAWRDVLTGDAFSASGDTLTVDVPARAARVLVAD